MGLYNSHLSPETLRKKNSSQGVKKIYYKKCQKIMTADTECTCLLGLFFLLFSVIFLAN